MLTRLNMKKHKQVITKLLLFLFAWQFTALGLVAQTSKSVINPDLLTKPWSAFWIGVPRPNTGGFGGGGGFGAQVPAEFSVYHFRKNFDLNAKPGTFIIHVSADNRYKLYVNGIQVSHGPSAGSPKYWNFETVDIAPHLQPGKNTAT